MPLRAELVPEPTPEVTVRPDRGAPLWIAAIKGGPDLLVRTTEAAAMADGAEHAAKYRWSPLAGAWVLR